jgi:hypothetical protein
MMMLWSHILRRRKHLSIRARTIGVGSFLLTVVLVAGIVYHLTRETRAAPGDYAVYRESTGLQSVGAALADVTWNTTVSQASLYSIDTGRSTVTLSEAGHYLVMYNLGVEVQSGTANGAVHGYINVNGTQNGYGRASCYLTNLQGQTRCLMSGASIVQTTAPNQTVKVQTNRLDGSALAIRRMANTSGFTVLRLSDNWTYARMRNTAGGQTFNTTAWTTVTFNTNDELGSGYSRTGGDITVADPGTYLVTTNVHFNSTQSGRSRQVATRLTLDGTEIPGTRATAFMATANQPNVASYVGVIETTGTNQVLRLQGACDAQQCGQTTNVGGGIALTIVRLADTVEVVRVRNATGGQQVLGTDAPVLWDTSDRVDTPFSHSTTTNTSRITVNENDGYLFLSSFYNARPINNSTVIMDPHWEWRSNGSSKLSYGGFSNLNRGYTGGTGGGHGAYTSGASGGAIFTSLTSGDYVEILNTNRTTGTVTDTTFQADRYALQGIRISTLNEPDITVSAIGSQVATTSVPSKDFYVGGAFAFAANHPFPTETITSVTIAETGTVDAQNDLSSIRLYYKFDTTSPYDCASVSFTGTSTETQFGSAVGSFSGPNGTATFTGSVVASSTQTVCMYVVLDVDSTANDSETIAIQITDPSTDVVLGGGPVGPASSVALQGQTTLQDHRLTLAHYHWRNDDGSEALATSATGGNEDTKLDNLPKNNPRRLRLAVNNDGSVTSPAVAYRLEYAKRGATCDASTGWTDVGVTGGAWNMFDSSNLTNGENTTNIATSTGGVTDPNTNFLTPNGGVRDTTSQTGPITLTSIDFVELEYSIVATNDAEDGESYCFRVTDAGTPIAAYDIYAEVSIAADVLVSAIGNHAPFVLASTSDFYIGGAWVVQDVAGTRDVTAVILNETGTVDAQNDLSNIRLYYKFDTTSPYDCASVSFSGTSTETQFGSTIGSFSGPNGTATFTGSSTISTTQSLCLYAVLDVDPTASDGDTVQLEITNPGNQVIVSTGSVNPNTPVGPTGSTTIQKALFEQGNYHWRNDDGTEAGASSATNGQENVNLTGVRKTETQRLRMSVNNAGSTSSVPTIFTLEYAPRTAACSVVTGWETVGTPGGAWVMSDSSFLTHGSDTTNIATSTGGVSDPNTTFLTPNSGVRDTQASTSALTLLDTNFVEFEFAIEASTIADFGATYCFRLTAEGTDINEYLYYPQATIQQNRDFYVQRGVATIPNSVSNITINAGTDYVAPRSSSSAFIRITNTMQTGAGGAGGGVQNSNLVTTYIIDPQNITSSVTFGRIGATGDTRVYWEIVEYTGPAGGDNEMIVRHAEGYAMDSRALVANIPASGVLNDDDVVVFLTGQANTQANTTQYHTGIVTTDWNSTTGEVVLERAARVGGGGNTIYVSYALVEFTGSNWFIQRVQHTYSAVGTTQTQPITTVNDVSRAFIHAQHRTTQNTVANFGHLVWFLNSGNVAFQLNSEATTAAGHTSVAWVIENIQTNGAPMAVTRSNGVQGTGGPSGSTFSIGIGKTLSDISVASIFTSMHASGIDVSHPRAIMGATIASSTHYELWVSDTGSQRTYRTEIVEWPTAVLSLTQNFYRFYVDNDTITPTDPWPPGATDLGENTAITSFDLPPTNGESIRIRMSLNVSGANISAGTFSFKLQYGQRTTTCTAVDTWTDLADTSSTTAVWRGYNGAPLNGTALSTNPPVAGDLKLSVADRAGTYQEMNPTAVNPYKVVIGEDVEYDWAIEAHAVPDLTSYCFRMIHEDGAELDDYLYYPTITSSGFEVIQEDWRWYSDVDVLTPTSPLAASNTSPINIGAGDSLALRVLLRETAGRNGLNTKFKLQWSESSDFSMVHDVSDIDTCTNGSRWCYYQGAGIEGTVIDAVVLEGADSCTNGVGDGCGTHNTYSYTPAVVGEMGTTTTDSLGTVVTLQHIYEDPVFIVESISGDASGAIANRPAAAIITATSTSSFSVRVQEPDDEDDDHGPEIVAYLVMERGSYRLPDGRRVDVNATTTDKYYGNIVSGASDGTCAFTQTFSAAPVLLTSLQSNNNTGSPDFFTASQLLVTADTFACSIEVPDNVTTPPTEPEVYGWIAIEGGTFRNNNITMLATTTPQSVTGWDNLPWYQVLFPFETFSAAPGIVASKQTRFGAEGGWVRYDTVTEESVRFAIDERDGGNRSHTAEVVGYLAFSEEGTIYREGVSPYSFPAGATVEFEFSLQHFDARANQTYFFRLWDVEREQAVEASATTSYPSLTTEGASLTLSVSGVAGGVATQGVVTDVETTHKDISFGTLTPGTPKNAAQRLTVTTNASEGYQVFVYERQPLTAGLATIKGVLGTNQSPLPWSAGCTATATSCYGYHTGDNILSGGSTRFLIDDTYATLSTTPAEIVYSSLPVTAQSTDIVYRIEVRAGQPAGRYESNLVYIVVPVF